MTTQDASPSPIARFQKQKGLLEKVATVSKAGFAQVTDQMGQFSVGFASSVTQAFSAQERLSPQDNLLGIKPLQEDYRRIDQETKAVLQAVGELVAQQSGIQDQLHQLTIWALDLEQDALLPTMAEQVRAQIGSGELERQTLGTIVDSLMTQIRTLIREILLATQDSSALLGETSRRLSADLESSKHHFSMLKSRSTTIMKQMVDRVQAMSNRCGSLEEQASPVNRILFEMMQGIQFDDITSQRLEHVIATLNQVAQRVTEGKLKNSDKRWVAIATRIAEEQLEGLTNDLVEAVSSLRERLGALEAIAGERKQNMVAARDDAMLFRIEIADLSFLLGALLRLSIFDDHFSIELLRNFSKTENSLFQTKRALDMLMLTAVRMDKLLVTLESKNNRRVESLSATIHQLMLRIQEQGNAQGQQLLQVTTQLQAIGLHYSEKSTPHIMRVVTLLRRVPLRAQQIEAEHGDLSTLFNEIIEETQTIMVQIRLLVATLDFHDPVKKGTDHVISRLQELLPELVGESISQTLTGDLSTLATEFADLASLYTMDRERKVHGSVLGADEAGEEESDGFELF
ncbi:MAG: hypothetical protein HQL80_01550 [Magnetococcales bacterium]|nr:hypothetical protein [Magnetococcales bacterium]MBF0582900.1 hypothetical protein [Magnetococcales bacterium]